MSCSTNGTHQISQANGSVGHLPAKAFPKEISLTFLIPDYRLRKLRKLLIPISRRLLARGFPAIKIAVSDHPREHTNADGTISRLVETTISCASPMVGSWRLIGKAKRKEIASFSGEPITLSDKSDLNRCDACGEKRPAKVLYIIQDGQANTKHIEASCLEAHTGDSDAQTIIRLAETIDDLRTHGEKFEQDTWDRGHGAGKYVPTEKYLAYVSAAVRKFGYVPKPKDFDGDISNCTAEKAFTAMIGKIDDLDWQPDEEDEEIAANAIKWVKEDLAKRDNYNNEYNQMLVTQITDSDSISSGWTSLVASLIPTFLKARERRMKERVQSMYSEHVGVVGEQRNFEGLTLMSVIPFTKEFTTQRGYRVASTAYTHKFSDQQGNILIWFATENDLQTGKVCKGKAIIKKHDEYKGTKQTVISNAKFVDSNQVYDENS